MSIISISGLTVDLGNQRILEDVDLDIDAGEWINIIGPNGAGKTTMLRSLLGTVEYTGTIELDGARPTKPIERARRLAYVCLLYTSPSPRDATLSRMPSSA